MVIFMAFNVRNSNFVQHTGSILYAFIIIYSMHIAELAQKIGIYVLYNISGFEMIFPVGIY